MEQAWLLPPFGTQAYLRAVSAIAQNDTWAVGYSGGYTLTMHWDGATWSTVASPNAGSGSNNLYAVLGLSSNDVWAAGTGSGQRLMEHWDGQSWSVISNPNTGTSRTGGQRPE